MPNVIPAADEFGRSPRYGEPTGPREVANTLGAPSVAFPKPATPPPKNPINNTIISQ